MLEFKHGNISQQHKDQTNDVLHTPQIALQM